MIWGPVGPHGASRLSSSPPVVVATVVYTVLYAVLYSVLYTVLYTVLYIVYSTVYSIVATTTGGGGGEERREAPWGPTGPQITSLLYYTVLYSVV